MQTISRNESELLLLLMITAQMMKTTAVKDERYRRPQRLDESPLSQRAKDAVKKKVEASNIQQTDSVKPMAVGRTKKWDEIAVSL